jgi:diguanylate cyclase (GGDEF)-like protein
LKEDFEQADDFRMRAIFGLGITTLVLLTPFSLVHFFQRDYVVGVGSMFIVAVIAAQAWSFSRRGRYYPALTFYCLVPAILVALVLVFQRQGVIGAFWCYPALLSFYFVLTERRAWLANVALLLIVVPMGWNYLDHATAYRVVATLVAVSAFSAVFVRVINSQQRKLEALALTDPLTGLPNRAMLSTTLDQAVQQSKRMSTPMTLIALDLDHFKSINDTFGHDAGDTVLRGVGDLLRKRLRRADNVFRVGGEEFLVLLYGADMQSGRAVAEELRAAIAALTLLTGRTVTASLGVAALQSDDTWTEWIKRSDNNLYQAKSAGRNRIAG